MAKGALIAAMDFTNVAADEFNDWYDTEHIPERARVPGFLTLQRWIGADNPRQSVATYDLESLSVLQGPGYRAIGGENLSPWSKRVTGRVERLLRYEGEQILPGEPGKLIFQADPPAPDPVPIEHDLVQRLLRHVTRRVPLALGLLDDDLKLASQLLLIDDRVPQGIGLNVQRGGEIGGGQNSEVARVVVSGAGVEIAARLRHLHRCRARCGDRASRSAHLMARGSRGTTGADVAMTDDVTHRADATTARDRVVETIVSLALAEKSPC